MPKYAICSLFGNAVGYIDRYFEQIEGLREQLRQSEPRSSLSLILGYGDDIDHTGELLAVYSSESIGARLIDVSHGGRIIGSFENEERFRQLAKAGNRVLAEIPEDADIAVWLESDLIWNPATMMMLLDRLNHLPAVAPRILHFDNPRLYPGKGPFWYDTFAFRRNGKRFANLPPYHADIANDLLQVDSAGSCLAMRGALARMVRLTEEDVIYGLCKQIYALGGTIWLDPSLTIYHP